MPQYSTQMAVFDRGFGRFPVEPGMTEIGVPTLPNCRTSALTVEWQMADSCAPGVDFGLWRTATIDDTHRTTFYVRQSGEILVGTNNG